MASSSKRRRTYDVFLNFRGKDVRNSFLAHLYKALDQNGIHTFMDNEELRTEDQISPELMKAIEESCIAIVVFSEDYASSRWCLDELVKIMECKEQKNLSVLPVFYKVDPRNVRRGKESYESALAMHESKLGNDSEKMRRWKKALFDAGCLSGWHLHDGDEAELIQKIMKKISTHLARTSLHVAKHPVGLDSRVAKLKSMLNLESNTDVVMVGLWGQGGIGKTTLAKTLYNSIFRQFEGSCFLANVRETSKGGRGLASLQKILLRDILLPQQRLGVSNVDGGINLIQHRLGRKKVLIILDDVDDLCQLNALAGEVSWFGDGSRIMITTRDKQLLTCCEIDQDHVYEVKPLVKNEAHELLRSHAFPRHQKSEIRKDLVDSIVYHACGLPLALEVLGSFLCGRREDVWESTLKKLSKIPNKTINDVLKISYDGLEENEKEIFLYIVCFFKGRNSEYLKKVLDSCDLATTIGLEVLFERSLISIEEYGFLNVHDLIQAMGTNIVNQECPDDPRKRSRLWMCADVVDALQHDMGDCVVKAIVLELPKPIEICINPDAFTKMRRLRLLILRNVHNSFHGPVYLPSELRWIEWAESGPLIPEFASDPKKLVGLDMGNCSITGVVKHLKGFKQLKFIKLSQCNSLVSTPNLSCTPKLEELNFRSCKNLTEVDGSIAHHDKLQALHFYDCPNLHVFPNVLKSKNLRDLEISFCPNFERFPEIPDELKGLKELTITDTSIKELPASIENLVSLEVMLLKGCKNLASLPSNIYKLQNLRRLQTCFLPVGFPKHRDLADSCMKIGLRNLVDLDLLDCKLSEVEFLEDLSCFPLLRRLYLRSTNITSLPTSISERDHLYLLDITGCHQLQEIPELPPSLKFLYADGCESLQTDGRFSIVQWVQRRLSRVDHASLDRDSSCLFHLPKGEMPEHIQPFEGHSITFMASKDSYDKFLGLILCAVHDENLHFGIDYEVQFNGKTWQGTIGEAIMKSQDGITLAYLPPSYLWEAVDFGQINGSYAQFSLKLYSVGVKKYGFRMIYKQSEDI